MLVGGSEATNRTPLNSLPANATPTPHYDIVDSGFADSTEHIMYASAGWNARDMTGIFHEYSTIGPRGYEDVRATYTPALAPQGLIYVPTVVSV